MCTISALALEGLTGFLQFLVEMKKTNSRKMPQFSLNSLRFPNFQSPLVLPLALRKKFSLQLEDFIKNNQEYLNEMEKSNCKRLVSYLNQEDTIHQQLDKNFKNYFNQYDKRRVKDFEKTFPVIGEWYRGI